MVFSTADGTPVSQAFGDVYFSRDGGVDETMHVFLRGNGLPERWAGRGRFTIGELGFGTGLNFLVAWKKWKETAPVGATLHYISIEKFPFKVADLRRIDHVSHRRLACKRGKRVGGLGRRLQHAARAGADER